MFLIGAAFAATGGIIAVGVPMAKGHVHITGSLALSFSYAAKHADLLPFFSSGHSSQTKRGTWRARMHASELTSRRMASVAILASL